MKLSATQKWWIVIIFLVLAIILGVIFRFTQLLSINFLPVNNGVTSPITSSLKDEFALAPYFLGFDKPRTFLLLFLNNTEMRPGGGFIGSYGILQIEKGKIISFTTNGSENLDWAAPANFNIEPPEPIKKYLSQPKWYFRDSNWSPDFKTSSENALRFYTAEGGAQAANLDGVIGITPTVLKELLNIIGSLNINGTTYIPEKVVEELEYHVEYGYKNAGQTIENRKSLIGEMGQALMKKLFAESPWRWKSLFDLFKKMVDEKQLMFFASDTNVQTTIENTLWGGRQTVVPVSTDFVQLVDANLASLKTDAVIDRNITYKVRKNNDEWVGDLAINYQHNGSYDWKTTRYRSFTRIYLPLENKLLESSGFVDDVKSKKSVLAQVSSEAGKQVWSGFWFVEPKQSYTLHFKYNLGAGIQNELNAGKYTLYAQKQLGIDRQTRLTVEVDFGTTVRRFEGDLLTDRLIELKQ